MKLLPLLAVTLLAGCTTTVVVQPPEYLLQNCEIPTFPVKTNKDLAELAVSRKTALEVCNADKEALRAWAKEK